MSMNIVSKEEVLECYRNSGYYSDEELEIMFAYHKDHPITEDDPGSHEYRWLQTIEYNTELGNDPNQTSMKYHRKEITFEEYMNYNRQIGYSLYGYWEIFCFNNRFDKKRYKKDMDILKIENRNKVIGEILCEK